MCQLKTTIMRVKVKFYSGLAVAFVLGAVCGILIPYPKADKDSAKGDIAKVSKYNRSVVGKSESVIKESLLNNPEELESTIESLSLLTSRMVEFDELVNIAATAAEGNEDLSACVEDLMKVQRLAKNARRSGEDALAALEAARDGKATDVDYEQATQNLAVAFLLVDRQINVGKQFVCEVDKYLEKKDADEYIDLALSRDLWVDYCCVEAAMNQDKEELAYWNKQSSLVSNPALAANSSAAKAFTNMSGNIICSQQIATSFKQAGLGNKFVSIKTGKGFLMKENASGEGCSSEGNPNGVEFFGEIGVGTDGAKDHTIQTLIQQAGALNQAELPKEESTLRPVG